MLATLARGKWLDDLDVDPILDQLPGISNALQPVTRCPGRVEYHEPDIRPALAVLDGAASRFQPAATANGFALGNKKPRPVKAGAARSCCARM